LLLLVVVGVETMWLVVAVLVVIEQVLAHLEVEHLLKLL